MANLADMPRRSFLTQVGTAGAAAAAAGLTVANPAAAQTGSARFQPPRHSQDDWLDALKDQIFREVRCSTRPITGPSSRTNPERYLGICSNREVLPLL